MNDWMAIVNRHAGRGRGHKSILDEVRNFADAVAFTAYPGHATGLARRAGDFRGLVVVGGDGTLLEVLNGIDLRRQTLAIVPTGRGNSLARDLGLYPAARGLRALASGRALAIDLLEVAFEDAAGWRHRTLSASMAAGYPAAVAQSAARRFSWLGKYGYAAAAAFLPPARTAMYISGNFACSRLTGFIASNTQHVANFMALPRANCRDGLFDVMELRAPYPAQLAHNLSALSRAGFYNPVTPRQTAEVSVRLERPQNLMIDGELHSDVTAFQIRGVRWLQPGGGTTDRSAPTRPPRQPGETRGGRCGRPAGRRGMATSPVPRLTGCRYTLAVDGTRRTEQEPLELEEPYLSD